MLSSLRFVGCIRDALAYRSCEGVDFGGFSNAVLEHIFSLPRSERGMVDYVVYSHGVETEKGTVDRIARFTLKIEGELYFVYVVAERVQPLHEWRVVGRSAFMRGIVRMPDYETEMIWL